MGCKEPRARTHLSSWGPSLAELSASSDPNAVVKVTIDPISEEEVKYVVPPEKIISGVYYSLPDRDGILSIDKPKFEGLNHANEWLSDDDFKKGRLGLTPSYTYRLEYTIDP